MRLILRTLRIGSLRLRVLGLGLAMLPASLVSRRNLRRAPPGPTRTPAHRGLSVPPMRLRPGSPAAPARRERVVVGPIRRRRSASPWAMAGSPSGAALVEMCVVTAKDRRRAAATDRAPLIADRGLEPETVAVRPSVKQSPGSAAPRPVAMERSMGRGATTVMRCPGTDAAMSVRWRVDSSAPWSANSIPDPATRSLTVLETRISPAPAVSATRAPMWTAIPLRLLPRSSHSPVCRPARTSRPSGATPCRTALAH